ncbi:hypothetical protein SNE40_006892 [Patella caerulea]|uniref:Hexosyltransferase n=2 Tax=Patella caerulea TaxID=87958 RepID=A0AAN8K4S7_PATCE
MITTRLKKKQIFTVTTFVFTFILIWRLYYAVPHPNSFLSEHSFDDARTHSYKYLINESGICGPFPDKIFLLITVFSRTSEIKERMAVRKTWGSLAVNNTEIRLVFMLGFRPEINHQEVKIESEKYHDIIQEDFYDSYRNLTIKSGAILRFANTFCQGVKYILKVDVDVFINLPFLIEELRKNNGKNMVMGHTLKSLVPHRNPKSKWYAESYPLTYYPNYASGPSYVLSGDIVGKLFRVALTTKYFYLEDVFVTGIVRERAAVKLVHHRGFTCRKPVVDICWFENQISGHPYTIEQMIDMWSKIKDKPCTWSVRIYYMWHNLVDWSR